MACIVMFDHVRLRRQQARDMPKDVAPDDMDVAQGHVAHAGVQPQSNLVKAVVSPQCRCRIILQL